MAPAEKGRFRSTPDSVTWLRHVFMTIPFKEAPLTNEVAFHSRSVHLPPQDPVDRFLAATAIVYDLTLVTADECLIQWLHERTSPLESEQALAAWIEPYHMRYLHLALRDGPPARSNNTISSATALSSWPLDKWGDTTGYLLYSSMHLRECIVPHPGRTINEIAWDLVAAAPCQA